jgi:hypothetical protein
MPVPVQKTNMEQIVKNIVQSEYTRLSDEVFTGDGQGKATARKRIASINYINPGGTIGGTGTTVAGA